MSVSGNFHCLFPPCHGHAGWLFTSHACLLLWGSLPPPSWGHWGNVFVVMPQPHAGISIPSSWEASWLGIMAWWGLRGDGACLFCLFLEGNGRAMPLPGNSPGTQCHQLLGRGTGAGRWWWGKGWWHGRECSAWVPMGNGVGWGLPACPSWEAAVRFSSN